MPLTPGEIDYQEEYRRAQQKLADMSRLVQQRELETKKAQVLAKSLEERSKRGNSASAAPLARDRELEEELAALRAQNTALQERQQRQKERMRALETEHNSKARNARVKAPNSSVTAAAAPRPLSSHYMPKQQARASSGYGGAGAGAGTSATNSSSSLQQQQGSVFSAPLPRPSTATSTSYSSNNNNNNNNNASYDNGADVSRTSSTRGVSLFDLPQPTVTNSNNYNNISTSTAGSAGSPAPASSGGGGFTSGFPPSLSLFPDSARSVLLPGERRALDDLSTTLRARLALSNGNIAAQTDVNRPAADAADAASVPAYSSSRGVSLSNPFSNPANANASANITPASFAPPADSSYNNLAALLASSGASSSASTYPLAGLSASGFGSADVSEELAMLRRDLKEKRAAVSILQAQFDQLIAAARAEKEVQAHALRQCEEYKRLLAESRRKTVELQRQISTLELESEHVAHYKAVLEELRTEKMALEDRVRLLTSNLFAGDAMEQARVKQLLADSAAKEAAVRAEAAEAKGDAGRAREAAAERARQLEVRTRELGIAAKERDEAKSQLAEASKQLALATAQLGQLANDSGIDFDRLREALDVVKRQDAQRKAGGAGAGEGMTRGIGLEAPTQEGTKSRYIVHIVKIQRYINLE